jgi:hypothetical protein
MRNVTISTDTFAAIWSKRQPGEDSEDAILQRILGVTLSPGSETSAIGSQSGNGGGVVDSRNGVSFPEGFRIFRHYKGREFEAEARHGSWVRLDNGSRYPTLNQLNASIAAGAENVWNGNWKFRDDSGHILSIGALRKH